MGSSGSRSIHGLTTTKGTFATNKRVRYKFASCAAQGSRPAMEDRLIALSGLPASGENRAIKDVGLFAVFDGHGGSFVVDYCVDHFLEVLQRQPAYTQFVTLYSAKEEFSDALQEALQKTFNDLEEFLRENHRTDSLKTGTTATVTLVTSDRVYVGNVGDSRALICNFTGKRRTQHTTTATQDHKPSDPVEKARITAAGSRVVLDRINGGLSMSRAIGDFSYKDKEELSEREQCVTVEMDFYAWEVSSHGSFLCLACDGLWNVFSNHVVVEKIIDFGKRAFTMVEMTHELTGLSLKSKDNVSIILVQLSTFANSRLLPFLGKPASAKRHFDSIRAIKQPDFTEDDGMIYF